VLSDGTVHSVPRSSQTSDEVGPSRAYPSVETQRTSSTPLAAPHRRDAMFTAYERVFAPASCHGAVGGSVTETASVAVPTEMPSLRARWCSALTPLTVAKTLGEPTVSGPRVHTSRSAPSVSRGHAAHA